MQFFGDQQRGKCPWDVVTSVGYPSMLFAGFLCLLVEHVGKLLTVILDNALVNTVLSPTATNERLDVVLPVTVQPGGDSLFVECLSSNTMNTRSRSSGGMTILRAGFDR